MGSEVAVIEEFNDVENTLFVAVGKNVKESKSLILWALQCFAGMKICLLHIHQPSQLITLLDDKFSASRLKQQVVKACRELEHQKMHKVLNQYSHILEEAGVQAGKVWIETDNVETGIVQTIAENGIRWLVMGAAAEKLYSKDVLKPKSNKARYVCQQAPISCHIWFACKGRLIYTRERSVSTSSYVRSIEALSSPPTATETMLTVYQAADADVEMSSLLCLENSTSTINVFSTSNSTPSLILPTATETALTLYHASDADEDVNSIRCLENSTSSTRNVFSTSTSTRLLIDDARGNGSTLLSPDESQDRLTRSFSAMFLEGSHGLSSSELHDKLAYAITDAENSKQKAFEESIRRWKAEEDAKEALHEAEASENSCMKEITQRKEMEGTLAKQSREIETMKNQRDQFIEELQMVRDQKPGLLDQISKARGTEEELEEKIIQAVNLLITFKESIDNLQGERDNARRQINKLRKYVDEETTSLSRAQFYKPSLLEIMEATQDFNQALKIGEGRWGSVYKGILRHVTVAIKMLPSLGSQGDAEFEHEAEVLSRMRHPNLVMLIGVCPETRSLIYEYLENGSLEDRIASRGTTPALPWHTRIRIASEICSALIFLHCNKPCMIHGNLMFTNVLLDSNYVCKLSDLGINRLILCKDRISSTSLYSIEPEVSAYMDPEFLESGKLAASSDIYSFGVVLLRILTGRPASSVVKDAKCALENGNFSTILDSSAGNWPNEQAMQLAYLGLRCCEKNPIDRPDLVNDIWTTFEPMKDLFTTSPVESENHRRIPSYFVCPIFQEVMKDPYIAADGFTYEADAIKGWLDGGHKTSPMTNLELDHCDLLPNYALSRAIQEWQQHS